MESAVESDMVFQKEESQSPFEVNVAASVIEDTDEANVSLSQQITTEIAEQKPIRKSTIKY